MIEIRPPEGAGDDLFAIGRIIGWLNRGNDPDLQFLSVWLSQIDFRLRLNDVGLARQFVLQLAAAPVTASSTLEEALRRLAKGGLEKAATVDDARAALQKERDASREECRRLSGELGASEVRAREFEQALIGSVAKTREYEQLDAAKQRQLQEAAQSVAAAQRRVEELEQALRAARLETDELKATIDFVNRSRFWKARNVWFAGKRAVGLAE